MLGPVIGAFQNRALEAGPLLENPNYVLSPYHRLEFVICANFPNALHKNLKCSFKNVESIKHGSQLRNTVNIKFSAAVVHRN